jgi:2,4-dienoyl-CoA reductase (NADPH2)
MTAAFPYLLSPGQIGSLTLRNRIFMTAMGSDLADGGGMGGERMAAYYGARARGGAGLIITEAAATGYPYGFLRPNCLALSEDRHIEGIRMIADAVHREDGKLCVQINHNGHKSVQDWRNGRQAWGPSTPIGAEAARAYAPKNAPAELFHCMTHEDIAHVVGLFATAANRAREAGADAVEIHGGHGYLLSSFLSPYTNSREDDYGGPIENRSRFLVEVIRAARTVVGSVFPIWCKIDSQEFLLNEGISVEDAKATALMAQEAGVNAINASAYADPNTGTAMHMAASHTPAETGHLLSNAAAIKSVLHIPVISAGRVEPAMAERSIARGELDFLSMGRKLLADPELPRKLKEGRIGDVRPCIYCQTCLSAIVAGQELRCAVNPETGFERERAILMTGTAKKIVVVGGGPGGMESARRLSLKGHHVTLLEKSDRLGGKLQFAAIAYEPNERLLDWLRHQISQLNIEVKLATNATVDRVKALAPDAVVVATGAQRNLVDIEGANRPNVFSEEDLYHLIMGDNLGELKHKTGLSTRLAARDSALTGTNRRPHIIREATRQWLPLGDHVVIIGGELIGLELAEFLAERGRKVTVIEELDKLGVGLPSVRAELLLKTLRRLEVNLLSSACAIEIGDGSVSYTNFRGQQRKLRADHVVIAKGATEDVATAQQFEAANLNVFTVGDCKSIDYIDGAFMDAALLAQTL